MFRCDVLTVTIKHMSQEFRELRHANPQHAASRSSLAVAKTGTRGVLQLVVLLRGTVREKLGILCKLKSRLGEVENSRSRLGEVENNRFQSKALGSALRSVSGQMM